MSAATNTIDQSANDLPDDKRIQGTWEIELSEHNGQPHSKAVWTFDGEKMISRPNRAVGGEATWVIKLDPKQKHIDISTYPGIYAFDGEKLKIAYRLGGARPTELKSDAETYYCELAKVKE